MVIWKKNVCIFVNKSKVANLINTPIYIQTSTFLSQLLIARCDIGVQLSVRPSVRSFVRPSVRPSTIHVKMLYSVAVIAGSMKPCIVITIDTLFKQAA